MIGCTCLFQGMDLAMVHLYLPPIQNLLATGNLEEVAVYKEMEMKSILRGCSKCFSYPMVPASMKLIHCV